MNYTARPTPTFTKQFSKLNKMTQKILFDKIELAENNPFRNKSLTGFKIKLFRIRIKDNNIEKRAIYTINKDTIILIAIIKRRHDYRELKRTLKKLGLI